MTNCYMSVSASATLSAASAVAVASASINNAPPSSAGLVDNIETHARRLVTSLQTDADVGSNGYPLSGSCRTFH